MVNAGIKTDEDAIVEYNALKLKHKYHYIIYHIQNNVVGIEASKLSSESFQYPDFVEALKACDGPRFAVVDYHYQEEGVERSKIIFVFWCPDSVRARTKMTYASAKEDFQKKLTGLQKVLQVNDEQELEEGEIVKAVMKQ